MVNRDDLKRQLIEKYKDKLQEELGGSIAEAPERIISTEYEQFKREILPAHMGIYEKGCKFAEKIFKMRMKPAKRAAIQESIDICHMSITPEGVVSFAYLVPIAILVFGSIFSFVFLNSLFFTAFFILAGLALIIPLQNWPDYLANGWRMKASNQMVLCIFYVVTYMRHTSNIELAINFAAEHLGPPLSLDMKKVMWDVETGKYGAVKESLDMYLETWRKWNREFIESFHLIESSLYENSDDRRLSLLDKSLDIILTETYEKMLHYAQDLKSPITMLHMMGIILPILGLVILPLVVSFMENVAWYHIAALYNVILPIVIFYLGKNILSKRPTGYGDIDISEMKGFKKYRNIIFKIGKTEIRINPIFLSIIVGVVFMFVAFSPIILHTLNSQFDLSAFGVDLLGYRVSKKTGESIGPYGLGASMLSLFFPLAIAFGIGLYYKFRSKNVMAIRDSSKKLEDEFASALFQLGNRLGDGLPAEIAFGKVAEVMQDSPSGNFFSIVSMNIRKLGMGIKDAIFDPRVGALRYYPSNIIESSMKVLMQSARKGPQIAAQALLNVARYIKEIHKVDERLKDLMADIISSMKSQINFMTPAISGIVVGITSMITTILGALGSQITRLGAEEGAGARVAGLSQLFGDGIPTYYFQIVVGLYVVQVVFILTILQNGIENGQDKLNERYLLGQNMIRSTLLYCGMAAIVMLIFNFIAVRILSATVAVA